MRGARVRERLQRDQPVLSVMLPFPSPAVVEMLGAASVDLVMLDGEHGAIDAAEIEAMVRAADVVDLPAIVRVAHNDPPSILRVLDAGASGIIAPHVTTADDARRAVDAARYGPLGHRSYGSPRAMLHGRRGDTRAYIEAANRETLVIGLFEDAAGLDHLDAILAVPGLDALAIGPNDLAFSMGHPAAVGHPEVQAAIDRIIAACRAAGRPTGLPASDLAQARSHVARGCRIISVGAAGLLIGAAREMARTLASGKITS